MNIRRLKCIDREISAEVSIDINWYDGSLINVSEDGLIEICFRDLDVTNMNSEKTLRVKFQDPSGEVRDVECRLIWFRLLGDDPDRTLSCLAMEIISLPKWYGQFIDNLLYS